MVGATYCFPRFYQHRMDGVESGYQQQIMFDDLTSSCSAPLTHMALKKRLFPQQDPRYGFYTTLTPTSLLRIVPYGYVPPPVSVQPGSMHLYTMTE